MEILLTVIVAVVLTAVVIAVARAGSSRHQETLNDHDTSVAAPDRSNLPARGDRTADRPAGPDAEAMGVAEPGQPSVDPGAEQRS